MRPVADYVLGVYRFLSLVRSALIHYSVRNRRDQRINESNQLDYEPLISELVTHRVIQARILARSRIGCSPFRVAVTHRSRRVADWVFVHGAYGWHDNEAGSCDG